MLQPILESLGCALLVAVGEQDLTNDQVGPGAGVRLSEPWVEPQELVHVGLGDLWFVQALWYFGTALQPCRFQ